VTRTRTSVRRTTEGAINVRNTPETLMTLPRQVQSGLLAGSMLFLMWLAWQALSGGFHQLPRSRTVGQKVETVVQIECGFLSLLVILTSFLWRRWAPLVRRLWSISLAITAGLSALVWGPPMPHIAALLAASALLVARAVLWILRTCLSDRPIDGGA
jgi:hypothetical protein